MVLVTSLQSRRSIADIAHVLAVPAVPLDTVVDTLRGAWLAFEINVRAGLVGAFSVADVLGATVELYRSVDPLFSLAVCHATSQNKSATSCGRRREGFIVVALEECSRYVFGNSLPCCIRRL